MTELASIASRLSSLYRENTQLLSDGKPSEIRWPYTEMVYNIVSILKEIEQLHSGGYFDNDYIHEKCDGIIRYAQDIKRKVNHGWPDDAPF